MTCTCLILHTKDFYQTLTLPRIQKYNLAVYLKPCQLSKLAPELMDTVPKISPGSYFKSFQTLGVSQCRVKLLQSHYFKHTTSSSAAEGLFQCPAYLEFYRARRTPFGEISRLHRSRLRGLKIPTMLCARTNFQIFG